MDKKLQNEIAKQVNIWIKSLYPKGVKELGELLTEIGFAIQTSVEQNMKGTVNKPNRTP